MAHFQGSRRSGWSSASSAAARSLVARSTRKLNMLSLDKAEPAPQHPVIVTCSCCCTAFRYSAGEVFKGQPSPNSTCSERPRAEAGTKGAAPHNKEEEKKPNGAILIAASLIAAVRLNREEIK